MFYIPHILFFLCTFAAEFTNSIVQNMMKSMKLFVAIVATVLSFSSCSKDNDNQVIQDNPLKNTEWSFERIQEGNANTTTHWGSLKFVSDTEVVNESGYKITFKKVTPDGHRRKDETHSETNTYKYALDGTKLTMYIPANGEQQPATTLTFRVDLKGGTITHTYNGTEKITDENIVYKRK